MVCNIIHNFNSIKRILHSQQARFELGSANPLLIKWIYWTSINCNLCTIYSQYLISFHWKFALSTKYIKKASNEIDRFKMIEYVVEALS